MSGSGASRRKRTAGAMSVALVVIVLLGGVSVLATISSIGASDGCGGCDASPAWASVGFTASVVLLAVWLVASAVLIVRWFARRRPRG